MEDALLIVLGAVLATAGGVVSELLVFRRERVLRNLDASRRWAEALASSLGDLKLMAMSVQASSIKAWTGPEDGVERAASLVERPAEPLRRLMEVAHGHEDEQLAAQADDLHEAVSRWTLQLGLFAIACARGLDTTEDATATEESRQEVLRRIDTLSAAQRAHLTG